MIKTCINCNKTIDIDEAFSGGSEGYWHIHCPESSESQMRSNALLSQSILYSGMAKIAERLEIALKALAEISEMKYKVGGETEEAEIARRAIENINSR